jgi:hypothetical protein
MTGRVYSLAKELGVDPRRILALCEKARIGGNQLSLLGAQACQLFSKLLRDDDSDGETHPSLVPVWKPPPTLQDAVRLKPPLSTQD